MPGVLAVFAKRPIPGRVKTRLTSRWTSEQAAEFYWAMVQDIWHRVSEIGRIEPMLFVDEYCDEFTDLAAGSRIELQTNGDLGARMHACLQQLTKDQLTSSLIIGTDSPSVPVEYLETAFSLLEASNDAVLGPTEDGGYYLVGCRQAHPDMFKGVSWSTESTFAGTRDAFNACGLHTRLASVWWDVDTPDDVERLAQSPNLGPNVREWLDRAGEFPAQHR
jgi:rSAM/selenodomain-associated transferase 1